MLCKYVAMLRCSYCGKNLCNVHAVDACWKINLPGVVPDHLVQHSLENVTATCCTVEVEE